MILDQQVVIPVPADRAWEFLMDIPAVSRCVPGVESIEQVDDDTYNGALKVKVGPIGVTLKGTVTVAERDRAAYRSRMTVQASDKRLNSAVSAQAVMTLVPRSETETEMRIHTESSILGKLGEFGQAVMRKKADQIIAEFARNMARELGGG
ncbi:MAG TPA: SRPBCC family protein [Candidatus Limnocylindrales bacterium]|nr:SRPBCC family protein [Candidatus Limnocylindrales bacterium]